MEALDCKGKDCNGEKVICKLVVYHQPKKDAVGWEQKLCCDYYDFFFIDFLDSVEYFGYVCVCAFPLRFFLL